MFLTSQHRTMQLLDNGFSTPTTWNYLISISILALTDLRCLSHRYSHHVSWNRSVRSVEVRKWSGIQDITYLPCFHCNVLDSSCWNWIYGSWSVIFGILLPSPWKPDWHWFLLTLYAGCLLLGFRLGNPFLIISAITPSTLLLFLSSFC